MLKKSLAKKGPFDENGKNGEFAFYPLKTRASLLEPQKTTKITKMAGVTQAKAWFRKSRVCSSLKLAFEEVELNKCISRLFVDRRILLS